MSLLTRFLPRCGIRRGKRWRYNQTMKTAVNFPVVLVTAPDWKTACGVASSLLAAPEPKQAGGST
jgi:hypothetical protein